MIFESLLLLLTPGTCENEKILSIVQYSPLYLGIRVGDDFLPPFFQLAAFRLVGTWKSAHNNVTQFDIFTGYCRSLMTSPVSAPSLTS
jgi:hypothetical protein